MTGLSTLPSTREQAKHALLLLGVPAPARLVVDVHAALFDGDLAMPELAALLRAEERTFHASRAPQSASTPPTPHAPVPPAPQVPVPPAPHALALPSAVTSAVERPAGEPLSADSPIDDAGPASAAEHPLLCPGLHLDLTPARGFVTLSTWPVADRICTPSAIRAATLVAVVRVAEFVAARPGACAARLMRQLAATVPGGLENLDVLNPAALAEVARTALDDPTLTAALAAETTLRQAAATGAARLDTAQQLFGLPSLPLQRGGA